MLPLSVSGNGPVVIFSTGLCNLMPSLGYSNFLGLLQQDLQVVCYDAPVALDRRNLERIAKEISPHRPIGYVGHSSLLPSLFETDVIGSRVLLDPAALPQKYDINKRSFVPQKTFSSCPTLIINAEYTSTAPVPFIPPEFSLVVHGDTVSKKEIQVGHADILDDWYASACHRIGIRGTTPLSEARFIRDHYRRRVADATTRFMMKHNACDTTI